MPESCCRSGNFVCPSLKEPREKEASLCSFHLRSYLALTRSVSTSLREGLLRGFVRRNWAYCHPICSKRARPSLWLWLIPNRWRFKTGLAEGFGLRPGREHLLLHHNSRCLGNLYTGAGGRGKNAMALKEIKGNEEPLPVVGQAYISLLHDTYLLLWPLF